MKKWFILIGIIAIFLIGGYFGLSFYAVKFIQGRLQKVVCPGLTITEIKVKPTHLSARGIRYEDPLSKKRIFHVEEMRVYPALFSSLKETLRIREWMILQPSLFFYRSREGILTGPLGFPERGEKEKEEKDRERKGGEAATIKIDRLRIQKGSIDFEDSKMGDPPAHIELRELDLEIKDIQYSLISAHSPIELKGKIKGKTKEGDIYTKGWIDLKTMDMETSFKVKEIELKIFEPYYRKKITAEIEAGTIDMESKIAVKKRMIDAPGQLELVNLQLAKGEGMVFHIPAKLLVSLLKDKGNRIKVQFHVKGNMDDPQFNLQENFLNRVAISLAGGLGIPIKVVGETVFGGTGKGAKGLAEGLKSVEELFKKKKEKKK